MIARPRFRLVHQGEKKHIRIILPEKVLPKVKSKEDLQQVLDWYSYPFIRHRVPDSTYARRRYVEVTRPALRFLCKKYGVEVPEWLKGNGHYDQLDPKEHEDMFGHEGPLNVKEFEEVKQAKGTPPQPKPTK